MVGEGRVVVKEVGVTWEWTPSTWEVVSLDLAGWVLLFVAISYFKDNRPESSLHLDKREITEGGNVCIYFTGLDRPWQATDRFSR